MKRDLLDYLCDPAAKSALRPEDELTDAAGDIAGGRLVSQSGHIYPIRDGIPRLVPDVANAAAVPSFGDEWNCFNFDQRKRDASAPGPARSCAQLHGRIPGGVPAPRSGAHTRRGFLTQHGADSRRLFGRELVGQDARLQAQILA